MPFVQVRDIEIYYEIHGSGHDGSRERVVQISGTGGDLRANPRRGRGELEQRFEVLMYDGRGLGQTSKPDIPYSMADYADDCAALMDTLGWDRAHVVGISFGGMVAQHVALRHPDRVDRLVLACTSAGGAGGSSADLAALHEIPLAERVSLVAPIVDTRNDFTTDPPTLAPSFDQILPMLSSPRLNASEHGADIGARRQLAARAEHDTWDQLSAISAPTFVVGGRFDGLAPPDNLVRLADRIPDAELRLFDGGHVFWIQDQEAWPAVVEFLAA